MSSFRPPKLNLDIEKLIREVKYRPAIWNRNNEEYTNRSLKTRMWDEVCENLIDYWKKLSVSQKTAIGGEIQKKWRNIKDAFKKDILIQKKISAGDNVRRKRTYIHFNALSFLENKSKSTFNSPLSLDGSDNESDNTSVDEEKPRNSARKRTRKTIQDEVDDIMTVKLEKISSEEDNSKSEHKQDLDNECDNSMDASLDKPNYTDNNDDFPLTKSQHTGQYPEILFVGSKGDDWDQEANDRMVSRSCQNKRCVRDDVKVYDEDIAFSEMMVPMLRKLTDEQKHFAKIEILNTLHRAKRYKPASETVTEVIRTESFIT